MWLGPSAVWDRCCCHPGRTTVRRFCLIAPTHQGLWRVQECSCGRTASTSRPTTGGQRRRSLPRSAVHPVVRTASRTRPTVGHRLLRRLATEPGPGRRTDRPGKRLDDRGRADEPARTGANTSGTSAPRSPAICRLATRPGRADPADPVVPAGSAGGTVNATLTSTTDRGRAITARHDAAGRNQHAPLVGAASAGSQIGGSPAAGPPPPARPRAMLQFSITCPDVATPAVFVARGMSSGPWLTRGNRVCRLVSLHYALIQPDGLPPFTDAPFNGAIRCCPDTPAPAEAGDGQESQFHLRPGRVIGRRGPWPIPPTARRVGFLIHPHNPLGNVAEHHPVGTLVVDLTTNRAQWCELSELRADRVGSVQQRTAPG